MRISKAIACVDGASNTEWRIWTVSRPDACGVNSEYAVRNTNTDNSNQCLYEIGRFDIPAGQSLVSSAMAKNGFD
jgi:hypothetical protein